MAEQPTLVTFSASLLEHVLIVAGTNRIRAGALPGGYMISIGEEGKALNIVGKDVDDAYRRFLFWLLTKKIEHSREELEKAAEAFLRQEDEAATFFIDRITEGGMSEFGKKVQEYRVSRGAGIYRAVDEIKQREDQPVGLEETRAAIHQLTGYEDIDPQEILAAFADWERLNKRPTE